MLADWLVASLRKVGCDSRSRTFPCRWCPAPILTRKPIRHNRRQFLSFVLAGVTSGIPTVAAWPDATHQRVAAGVPATCGGTVTVSVGDNEQLKSLAARGAFEEVVLEVIGGNSSGELLPGFDAQVIADTILRFTGHTGSPENVHGMDNLTGCGLFPLTVVELERVRRYRFWILFEE